MPPELLFEFRLACQDDLQKLLTRCFEVEEEPDFLEGVIGEALRLVNDKDGRLAGAEAFEEPVVEGD